jgi:ABC-type multidrug transport system fused ATPase/permease subunit
VVRALAAEWWSTALVTAVWVTTAVGLLVAMWYGSRAVATGERRAGDLLAFALYAAQAIEPLRRLADFQSRWQRTLAAATRLFAVLDLAPEPPSGGRLTLPRPRGALAVERLGFSYPGGEAVLDELSFTLAAGETAALVAASGGGKTTLAHLLLGFRTPASGAIRFDGVDLRQLDRASLRRAVGVVFQEPFLFRASLAENLGYGAGAPSEVELRRAAEAAGLETLLRVLPRGLRSDLEEAGRSLSAGERQRIALARAVLRAPALLVLDEATSSVDSETEEAILDRLGPWFAQRTVLLISHRFSTVRRQPRVLVLERGRLAGDGRPEALLETCSSFRQLFAAQTAVLV